MRQVFRPIFYRSLFLVTVLVLSVSIARGQDTGLVEKAHKIFVEKRCYTCHTINAEAEAIEKEKVEFAKTKGVEVKEDDDEDEDEKKKIGGDLSHVGKIKDAESIKTFLQNPRGNFKDTAECRRKERSKYKKRFRGTDEELETIVSYLSGLKYEEQQAPGFETCLKEF
ncbi:MAG TPA: c-type cytochrome [Thermodesulfobacteriota bacterium]|nr:c-type cytochrome [Thermodesulfobacteriota bacterium]